MSGVLYVLEHAVFCAMCYVLCAMLVSDWLVGIYLQIKLQEVMSCVLRKGKNN